MRLRSALLVVTCALAEGAYAQTAPAPAAPEATPPGIQASEGAAESGRPASKAQPGQPTAWWNERRLPRSAYSINARKLPRIQVSGNRFVDERGRPMLFRGL